MTHYISRTVSASNLDWIWSPATDAKFNADNDGEYPTWGQVYIDLSQAMSQRLGRQMSQFSTYRVSYISIELRNVDDAFDNEGGLILQGQCKYFSPTKHRIDALKLARMVEKHIESGEVDADSWLLSNQEDYRGLRFNMDGDGQTTFATSESLSALPETEWQMQDLFDVYDIQLGVATQQNALWASGRTGYTNSIGWSTSFENSYEADAGTNTNPLHVNPFVFQTDHQGALEVLGGLLKLDITHSNVEHSEDLDDTNDDDYQMYVTIGVDGWRDF